MRFFSLAWSGHQAVLFTRFGHIISHTWLVLGGHLNTHSWRSLMCLQRIVGQKVALIPPLTQCLLSPRPNIYSSWVHMKPRLPGWMPYADFQWVCPIESFWQGVVKQGISIDSPFVIHDGQQYWMVTHNHHQISHVGVTDEADNEVSEVMYFQSLGGLCCLGV